MFMKKVGKSEAEPGTAGSMGDDRMIIQKFQITLQLKKRQTLAGHLEDCQALFYFGEKQKVATYDQKVDGSKSQIAVDDGKKSAILKKSSRVGVSWGSNSNCRKQIEQ